MFVRCAMCFMTFWLLALLPTLTTSQILTRNNDHVLAAQKGDVPPCAQQTGQTFCENVKNYPYELIFGAIKNSNFNVKDLLVDESRAEGPNLNNFKPASFTPGRRGFSKAPQPFGKSPNTFNAQKSPIKSPNGLTPNWERQLFPRFKRQSTGGDTGSPICQYTSRYVYPKTAMCASTGEWMFIINVQANADQMTQMIRTEMCHKGVDGKPCMDCGDNLSFGFTSRCEQHYNQKRLVALSSSGNQIVQEMFWLPTCCICRTFRV